MNQNIPLTSLNDKITLNDTNIDNNKKIFIKKTALDKIFGSVTEKTKFANLLINISNILENDKLDLKPNKDNFFSNIINKFKNNNIQYSNLKEEELQNTSGIFDFVKNHMTDIFDSIESSGDTLFSLLMIKREYTKAVFIDNFFNNMFIWGCKLFSSTNQNNLHSTKNIKKIIDDTMKLFEDFWNSPEIMNCRELTLIKDIEAIYNYFEVIQNNLRYVGLNTKEGFIKLINDNLIDENNNYYDYEQILKKINIGNYVPLHCGHNGVLNNEEAELLQKFLSKSSFMNEKNDEKDIKDNGDKLEEDSDEINTSSMGSDKNINNII